MALQFEDIPIPFVAGQTHAADEPLIQPPGLVRLVGGELADRDNIKVVDGIDTFAVSTMTGETAPSSDHPLLRRVHDWQGTLLLENFDGIFRRQFAKFALAAGSNNRKRESLRARRAGVSSIAEAHGSQADDWNQNRRPNAGTLGVDAAVSGDYTCVVWCEQYGTAATFKQVSWIIRHKDGDIIGRGRIRRNGADVKEPRVVASHSIFHIYGITGGDLGYLGIDPTATQNVPEAFTVLAATGTYTWLDVVLSPTQIGISVASATVVDTYIYTRATTPGFVGVTGTLTPGAPTPVANIYVNTGGAGVNTAFVTFYACAGTVQTLRWLAVDTTAAALGVGAQAITPAIARPVAFKDWAGDPKTIPIFLDTIGASHSAASIEMVRYDATTAASGSMSSGASTFTILAEHVCASLPVVAPSYTYTGVENQGVMLGVYYASSVQSVFQVFDIARAVTDAGTGLATPNTPFSMLRVFDAGAWVDSNVTFASGALVGRVCAPVAVPGESYGMHFWSAKFTPNITNVTDLGQNPTNIQRSTLRLDAPLGAHQYANLLYLAGGTPLCYDGQDIFEEGFTHAPEGSVVAAGGAGPLSAGSYGLVLVYEWFDGQGNRWQSQVGPAITFTAVAGNTYTVTARSLRGSLKSGVQIVPYRTTGAGGNIYYRDSPLGVTPLTDTNLARCETLYTAGVVTQLGTQSNNALPGVDSFCTHQERLVACGGESSAQFFYSKERSPRFPAEFNRASGSGLVPEACGDLRAVASMDSKLVLFGTESLAVVFGQGPNFAWAQNGYGTADMLQATEGVRSDTPFVVVVPEGVWYVTLLGPRLLGRNLATAVSQRGLPLGTEIVNSDKSPIGKCEAVFAHPNRSQVLFWTAASRTTFTYDTTRNQWSKREDTYLLHDTIHAATVGSVVNFIADFDLSTLGLRFFNPASTASNTLTIETGWISFAGLQKFQRLTHLQILATERETGVAAATYEFRLRVYVDGDPSFAVQDSTIEITPLNVASAPFQCEFQLHRQTSTMYKFVLDLRPPNSDEGGNFALVSMLATVGLKRGGAKLSNAERA